MNTIKTLLTQNDNNTLIEKLTGKSLAYRNSKHRKRINNEAKIMNEINNDVELQYKLSKIRRCKPSMDVWFDEQHTYDGKIRTMRGIDNNLKSRIDSNLDTWNTNDPRFRRLLQEYYTPDKSGTKLEIIRSKVQKHMKEQKMQHNINDDNTIDDNEYSDMKFFSTLSYDPMVKKYKSKRKIRGMKGDKEQNVQNNKSHSNRYIACNALHKQMAEKWCEMIVNDEYQSRLQGYNRMLVEYKNRITLCGLSWNEVQFMLQHALDNKNNLLLQYIAEVVKINGLSKEYNDWMCHNYNDMLNDVDNDIHNMMFDQMYQNGILHYNALCNKLQIKYIEGINISCNGLIEQCQNGNTNNADFILQFPHVNRSEWKYGALEQLKNDNEDVLKLYKKHKLPGIYNADMIYAC